MFIQYDFSKYLVGLLNEFAPEIVTMGGYDAVQLDATFRALSLSQKVDLMIKTVNRLEIFDQILAPITRVTDTPTVEEIWINGTWSEGNMDTRSLGDKFKKRTLSIPAKYYDYQVNISRKDITSALSMEATSSRARSSMVAMEGMLVNAVEGYRKKMRTVALKAIFANPVSEDPTLPVLYRDTTGFAVANQVVPPQNGLLTFETAEAQEHHLWQDGVSEDMLEKMRDLIVNKGGNGEAIVILANRKTWKKFTAQFTTDELEKLNLINSLGVADIAPSPITSTINMQLPDSDMPDDYWTAIDYSKVLLNKRESDIPELRGISVSFDTLSKLMGNSTGEPTSTQIAEANRALESAVINGSIKFEAHDVGFGVVNSGGAVVMFSGTGATVYVEPNWEV